MNALSPLASRGLVTAGEAARRLGVAPITIQRWVDEGSMRARRTAGGHRRIPVAEIRKRLMSARPGDIRHDLADWLDVLMAGDPNEVVRLLRLARARAGRWAAVADRIAPVLVELGELWQGGDCSVFEEHIATEALRRAAAACATERQRRRGERVAPRALLTTVPGERHTLGLSLAELVLAEHGWRGIWVGEGPPATEIPSMVAKLAPDLCIVAAPFDAQPKALRTVQRSVARAVAASGGRLVLAGQARWRPMTSGYRCRTFLELDGVLAGLAPQKGR